MSTITFDTLKFTKTLTHGGFSTEQAEALAQAQQDALADATTNALATRADVADLRYEVRLVKWMVGACMAMSAATISMLARMIFGH